MGALKGVPLYLNNSRTSRFAATNPATVERFAEPIAQARLIARRAKTCPAPLCKNILIFRNPKSVVYPLPSRPTEGRFAIVTDAGRDAVDADVPMTNGA